MCTYDILSRVVSREDLARLCGRDLELRDDGNSLDLLAPRELDVLADVERRLRGDLAGIYTACRGRENLAQWNLYPGDILGGKRVQVGADKSSKEGGTNVVRVALCHIR
jgi:hypothetical protein